MIRVAMEVREGAARSIATVQAESIREAVSITKRRCPGRDVRVMFPINPEDFFIEGPAEGNSRKKLSMVAAAECGPAADGTVVTRIYTDCGEPTSGLEPLTPAHYE
jgi:hypothetical protein